MEKGIDALRTERKAEQNESSQLQLKHKKDIETLEKENKDTNCKMQATIQQKNELKQQNENLKREKIGIEHQLCYAKEEMEKYLTNTKKMHDEAVLSNDVLTKGNKELKEKNEQLINENKDLLSKRSSLTKLFHKEVKELQEKVIKSKSFERRKYQLCRKKKHFPSIKTKC